MKRQALSPVVIGLVILAVVALSAYIFFQIFWGPPEAAPPAPLPPPAAVIDEAPPAEAPPLPELGESDPTIRTLLNQLSAHPRFAAWVTPDRLVERFVAAVANVARGESPRSHVGFLEPGGRHLPTVRDGAIYLNRKSYGRYGTTTEVFTSLDTAAGVRLYRQLKPLFDEAYRELGYPSGEFDVALAKAIDEILDTPIPAGDLELERQVTTYKLKDPALEGLSAAQKHFLRMGPANMRQIQVKLRLMRTALNLPQPGS